MTTWFRQVWTECRTGTIDEFFPPASTGHAENGDRGPGSFRASREGL
jgi:hypothetical protein